MAFVTADRIADTTTTVGTSPLVVSGTAPLGSRTFSTVMSVGDTCYYSVQHQLLNEWEVGLATYSATNTLTRTTIYSSSNAGSAVSFSLGTKDVFITMAASRSLQLDASGNITPAVGTYTRTTFTATAGQTSFTASYTVGYVQVYLNGILLNSADYTATTGTTVVLASAAAAGDLVDVIALNIGTFSSGGYTRTDYTATAGQTTFTAAYTPGYVQVYLNGVMLDITDYTASSGTSIVLGTGAAVGDTVSIVALTVSGFTGGVTVTGTPTSGQLAAWTGATSIQGINSYPVLQGVQTTSFAAVAGRAYPVNTTSGAVTVTLPASPSAGQVVQVIDYAGTFGTNGCIISRNGSNINGLAANSLLNVSRESVSLVYVDATQGWVASSAFIATNLGQNYTATYLIVAGGGGGGSGRGGGGGAGGLLTGSVTLSTATVYSITVGAGGAANANGVDSSGVGFTATGGGRGGGEAGYGVSLNGASGGSGGGGAADTGTGGSGTSGQGFAGGTALIGLPNYLAGGGGGASAVGGNATSGAAGNGGAGTASSITGSSVTYAGGGGGSGNSGTPGSGGAGGGGAGTVTAGATGGAGTANTGGGGGGGAGTATRGTGGAGGSGVVILSVPTVNYSGVTTGSPTVTVSGANTILRFTASGSYTA